jgi:hypothetical protein
MNHNVIDLAGAVITHNDDHTVAKAFIGKGDAMVVKGYSTEDRWNPCALELAIKFTRANGIDVPRELDPYAPPLPPEPVNDPAPEPEEAK